MKYGDDMIFDVTPETILGYQMAEDEPRCLELISGDRYEIHYGIHQGTYIYEVPTMRLTVRTIHIL